MQLRSVLYTSQPLYAPAAGGGTDNLTRDSKSQRLVRPMSVSSMELAARGQNSPPI